MFDITSDLPIIGVTMYQLLKPVKLARPTSCFVCILKGNLTLTIEQETPTELKNEDILFLSSETVCEMVPHSPVVFMYIEFHPYFLLSALGFNYRNISYDSRTYPRTGRQKFQNDLASLAVACLADYTDHSCQVISKAYHILHYIALEENNPVNSTRIEQKLLAYHTYIEENYQRPLSLTDVAEQLSYTPQYLANFLKKNLHMTFQEHLNSLRLSAALLLIKFSRENNGRIAMMCGFTNTSSFEHAFAKSYQCTPEEYRYEYLLTHSSMQPDGMTAMTNITLELDYIYNYMHYLSKHDLLHEDFLTQMEKVNTARQTTLSPTWNQIINLGTVTDFEKPAFRYALRIIQDEIPFEYGRCIGLFSLISAHETDSQTSYDFSKVFDMIDYLRSIHLKPLFEITNKPFHIYKDDETAQMDYSEYLEPAKYDTFLYNLLPVFIKVCINRYGFDEFTAWRFEVWRRYAPAMVSLEEPAVYRARFEKISSIIKTLVPHVHIGGPGFNTYLSGKKFEELMSVFTDSPYRPDFISAYYFPYMAKENAPADKLSGYTTAPKARTMHEKILELNAVIHKLGFDNTPLYITEYSSYLSTSNYINDSTYPAIFILQQVIDNYGCVDALAYWLASDISLAYGNFTSPLFGGNGILSKDSIPKASFYAFSFLNQLGHYLVARGEHYIITSSGENDYQVLIFYPSTLNQEFSASPFNQELLHYPYSAFEDVLPLDFQLDLTHLTSGTYLVKTQTINLNHGNILKSWGQLEYLKTLRRSEVSYLRHESVPSTQIKFEQVENSFYLQTHLNRNEAVLVTLELY